MTTAAATVYNPPQTLTAGGCMSGNDKGLSMSELQAAGDWARLDSVKRYAVVEVARRKELLEGKVVHIQQRREG